MTREQAVARLTKLYGKRSAYRVNEDAPTAYQREKAQDRVQFYRAERKALEERIVARRNLLLNQDAEYVAMTTRRDEVNRQLKDSEGTAHYHKFEAGFIDNILGAFHIEAQGDTWEEIFEKLAKKGKAS